MQPNFFADLRTAVNQLQSAIANYQRPPSTQESITQCILGRGNQQFIRYYPSITDPNRVISAQVEPVDMPTATLLANLFEHIAQTTGLPIAFLLGAIYQESRFDPHAVNHNLFEYHGQSTFFGTDWGLCQFSGRNLPEWTGLGAYPNTPTPQIEAPYTAMAFDPNWTLPKFGELMAGHYAWAGKQLEDENLFKMVMGLPPSVIPSLPSGKPWREWAQLWLTTSAYNSGEAGVLKVVEAGGQKKSTLYTHGFSVLTWTTQIEKELSPTG